MNDKPITAEAFNLANSLGHARGINGHNINGPSAAEIAAAALAVQRSRILENFIAQYLEATGTSIEDTVLCEQRDFDGTTRYWCEPKGER